MYRFFARGDSDDSDSDTDSTSSDEDFTPGTIKKPSNVPPGMSEKRAKFLRRDETDDSSDSEDFDDNLSDSDQSGSETEGVKKVVKSARDKRFEEMRAFVKTLKNAKKINDWVAIQNEFDKLAAAYLKFTTNKNEPHQRFYVRTSVELEELVKTVSDNKDALKKMNATQAKAFNAMKQKMKRHNKNFQVEITKFLANRITESESEDETVEVIIVKKPEMTRSVKEEEIEDKTSDDDEKEEDGSFTIV
ncbi:Eukaryotic translation initiation factor 3 subunit C, partial [Nowakowskiella sp. JEL0078]